GPRGTAAARHNGGKGASGTPGAAAAALSLGALGIVFGDIGTSPLYAMSSIFAVHGVRPDAAGVDGMISLVLGLQMKGRAAKAALVLLGIFGVALFFGDATITPAISVISSVEGLG